MRHVAFVCGLLAALTACQAFAQPIMPRYDRLRVTTEPATSDVIGVLRGTTPYQMTWHQLMFADSGAGVAVAAKCTALEKGNPVVKQTVLTLALTGANDLDLADGAHGTGVKIYGWPAGRILVLGATISASVVTNDAYNANPNDIFYVSAGTAVGADDADLTSTEADLIPKTTLDTVGNTTLTLPWGAALAASAHFDGTTTAKDVYINAAIADASNTKAATYAITGTLTLTWINLGDY